MKSNNTGVVDNPLIQFLEKVITSIDMVTQDGYIFSKGLKSIGPQLLYKDKPFVLPLTEHINSLITKHGQGAKIVVTKIPYNPISEDAVKGDSLSLKRTKSAIEMKLSMAVNILGLRLLRIAADKELQVKNTMLINTFLKSISDNKINTIKKMVDDTSVKNWFKLIESQIDDGQYVTQFYLKKGGEAIVNGMSTKYNRLASLSLPMQPLLEKAGNDSSTILGVKLRAKEIVVYRELIKFMLPLKSFGSNDDKYPAFISLMTMFLKTSERINTLLDMTKHAAIPSEESNDPRINIKHLSLDELDHLNRYTSYLAAIPSEIELTRNIVEQKRQSDTLNQHKQIGALDLTRPLEPNANQQVNSYANTKDVSAGTEISVLDKILGESPIQQPMYNNNTPQPMMPPNNAMGGGQPIYNNPIPQPYNSMGGGQPIYNNPVPTQSMMPPNHAMGGTGQPMYGNPIPPVHNPYNGMGGGQNMNGYNPTGGHVPMPYYRP